MSKHPVPKKKTPKAKSRSRFSTFQKNVQKGILNRTHLVDCPDCKQKRLAHHACPRCGKYRGRQVTDMEKEIDKITTIKA